MNPFNMNEFIELSHQLNKNAFIEEIRIQYSTSSFFHKLKKSILKNRRGEVVFCVIRPNKKIITVTCHDYPKGIYRIPTGGIHYNENIMDALQREIHEELGIDTDILDFPGVLKLRFEYQEDRFMFYSYLFIVREIGGRLLEGASDNEISEIKEVSLSEFNTMLHSLRDIQGKWHDWGRFRFETSNAVYQYLKKNCQELGLDEDENIIGE